MLVVRVRVDCGHLRRADSEVFVYDFGDGREAVGRTRSVRDDVVRRGVVSRFVDAEDDCDVLVLRGRADDDLLDGAAQVLARVLRFGEAARRLDDYLGPDRLPRNLRRVFLGEDSELVAADADAVLGRLDLLVEVAEDRVVLQKVCERVRVRDVVDGDEINLRVAE